MALFMLPLASITARAQGVGLPGGPSVSNSVTVVFFNYAGDADGYTKGIWIYGTNGYFTSAIPAGKALVITDICASINRNTTTTAQSIHLELRAGTPPLPAMPPSFTTGRLGLWEAHFDAGQSSTVSNQSWNTGLAFVADRLPYIVYSPGGVSAGVYAIFRAQGYLVDLPATVVATSPIFTPAPAILEEK
jgi:hypothetical protein